MTARQKTILIGLWFITLLLGVAMASEGADRSYGSVRVSEVVSVYDGDTFKVNIFGWPDIIGHEISIRIYGIDTPEIRGTSGEVKKKAIQARDLLRGMLKHAKHIELSGIKRGKYFRIVADVYVDGLSVAELMLDAGLAKPYYGGSRPAW